MNVLKKVAAGAAGGMPPDQGGGILGAIKRHPKTAIGLGIAAGVGGIYGGDAVLNTIGRSNPHLGFIGDHSGKIMAGATGVGAYQGVKYINNRLKNENNSSDLSNPNNWR